MSFGSLALIGAAIFVSSLVSGVFGIAGAMILLGVLLVFFDVSTAMVMLSLLTTAGNTWRVVAWWRYVDWSIWRAYILGAAVAVLALRSVEFLPSKWLVYLILGLIPFAIELLPRAFHPKIEWRGAAIFCGFSTTAIQLIAGNGGLIMDVFFQKSKLSRHTTVATKATCGTVGNVARLVYFGSLAGIDEKFPLWAFVPAILLALAASALAPLILHRMTDDGFRRWTRVLIFTVSAVYLVRAAWLFMHA
jgi:uncharacterized membrane protein YfcA